MPDEVISDDDIQQYSLFLRKLFIWQHCNGL